MTVNLFGTKLFKNKGDLDDIGLQGKSPVHHFLGGKKGLRN